MHYGRHLFISERGNIAKALPITAPHRTAHYHLTHLVTAALAPGQLGDGHSDEDHQETRGEVLLITLTLGGRGLLQCGQEVRVNLGHNIMDKN